MVIKPFLLLGLAVDTDNDNGCDQQLCNKLSWQHLRRSAIPEIWLVLTKI